VGSSKIHRTPWLLSSLPVVKGGRCDDCIPASIVIPIAPIAMAVRRICNHGAPGTGKTLLAKAIAN